jgi:hypothetical protein
LRRCSGARLGLILIRFHARNCFVESFEQCLSWLCELLGVKENVCDVLSWNDEVLPLSFAREPENLLARRGNWGVALNLHVIMLV